ncbi:hypothetical protein CG716_29330, partial [Mycolicibacterium sphagni]
AEVVRTADLAITAVVAAVMGMAMATTGMATVMEMEIAMTHTMVLTTPTRPIPPVSVPRNGTRFWRWRRGIDRTPLSICRLSSSSITWRSLMTVQLDLCRSIILRSTDWRRLTEQRS